MPDPINAGETPAPAATPVAAPAAPQVGADGTPFDPARAQSTIEALRAEIKAIKGTSKELEAAQAKLREYEQAQLSETERLNAQLADANAKAADLESKYQTALIRTAVEREAAKAGAIDPEVVYALIERSAVTLTDGAVSGAEKAVKSLLDAKPYLKTGEQTPAPAARSTPATPRPAAAPGRNERVQETREQMRANPRYAF